MAEQQRIAKTRGRYRLKARADAMDRTRERITEAAIELHGTVGPAATTLSAVAKRAGVTRATLYRHFSTEADLFAACSGEWLSRHPRPNMEAWIAIDDPIERLRHALGELYAYYRQTEQMVGNLLRDLPALPTQIAANLASYPARMADALEHGWAGPNVARHAALLLVVSFEAWKILAGAGIDDAEAAEMMAGFVLGPIGAADQAPDDRSDATNAASVGVAPSPSFAPSRAG